MELMTRWFSSGNASVGFDDVQIAIQRPDKYVIVSTLPAHDQSCLIAGTIRIDQEEGAVNDMLDKYGAQKTIVVYGKHAGDETAGKKQKQLVAHGIVDVHVYSGGLFEWLLLQDIYGDPDFPTTSKPADMLYFRQKRTF